MARRLATGHLKIEHSLDEWNSPLRETLNREAFLAECRIRVPDPAARASLGDVRYPRVAGDQHVDGGSCESSGDATSSSSVMATDLAK